MDDILQIIQSADSSEINEMIQAMLHRYSSLFPDWEIVFLSFPKNNTTDKTQQLNSLIDFLSNLRDRQIMEY